MEPASVPSRFPIPIVTDRLTQRPYAEDDAEAMFALFSVAEVGRFTGGVHETVDRSRATIALELRHLAAHGFSMFAVEERATGGLVGEVGLQLVEQRGPDVEIGWALHPDVQGRSYATEAARAWLDVAFGPLGLDRVVALIDPDNEPSKRVARALGMTPTGLRRAYGHDLEQYVLRPGTTRPHAATDRPPHPTP
jgi:RimJ/RimL family protein N-acetyltransferase